MKNEIKIDLFNSGASRIDQIRRTLEILAQTPFQMQLEDGSIPEANLTFPGGKTRFYQARLNFSKIEDYTGKLFVSPISSAYTELPLVWLPGETHVSIGNNTSFRYYPKNKAFPLEREKVELEISIPIKKGTRTYRFRTNIPASKVYLKIE